MSTINTGLFSIRSCKNRSFSSFENGDSTNKESDARLVELTTGAEIDLRTPARPALSAVREVTTTQPAATAANPPELTFAGRPAHPRH